MKKTLVLTLLVVLAFSASAMAATTWTTTGYVKYGFDKVGDADASWFYSNRLNFAGTVNDLSGFQIRFDTDSTATAPANTTNWAIKRYNFWTKTPYGKLVVGNQTDVLGGLVFWYGQPTDWMSQSTRIGFYPTINDKVTVFASWDPTNEVVAASGRYVAGPVGAWGLVSKAEADEDAKIVFGGSYKVANLVTAYGQYQVKGDTNEQFVGAKATLAGIVCNAEFRLQDAKYAFDFQKSINGVIWDLNYTRAEGDDDGQIEFYGKLNF